MLKMNKKEWLDNLYYNIGKQKYDFFVCGLRKGNDGIIATKWKRYSEVCFPLNPWEDYKIDWINQRQILPIEVVLDIEEKEKLKPIVEKLEKWGVFFYTFETGSRGYHIHIFFEKELNSLEKLRIIRYFKTDEQKCSDKTMIALEYAKHWKTGNAKHEIKI